MTETSLSSLFLTSTSGRPPLRVGLLLDGPILSRVSAAVIRDLRAADFVLLALIIVGRPATSLRRSGLVDMRAADRPRRRLRPGHAAYRLYEWLDRKRLRLRDDPLEGEDCSSLIAGIETITLPPAGSGGRGRVSADILASIRSAEIDVLLDLGPDAVRAELAPAARLGVWSLEFGDGGRDRDAPVCFGEILEGRDVSHAQLRRQISDTDPGLALTRASFATDRTSLARTRRMVCYGSVHLVISALWRLHQLGWEAVSAHVPPPVPEPGADPVRGDPSLAAVLRWLVPLVWRKAVTTVRRTIAREDNVLHWRIAIRIGHAASGFGGRPDMSGFKWIESPAGHFWADPFVVERDGQSWLFVEDFSYAAGAAVIACAEISASGDIGEMRPVLRIDGHLSYPMVVSDGPVLWMIPESASDRAVRLYRAVTPPWQWEAVSEPFHGAAVDTTVWEDGGRWWFATTVVDARSGAGALMLFSAESISGQWVSHPMNPISQDVRSNRGAGAPFRTNGRWIRPSQDGSRGYGYGFAFNEIVTLSATEYVERRVAAVGPDWAPGIVGTHTYNRAGGVEVTDGKVLRARRAVL